MFRRNTAQRTRVCGFVCMPAQLVEVVWREFGILLLSTRYCGQRAFMGCGYNVCHISHGELTHAVTRLRVAMTYARIEMIIWLNPLGSSEEQDTQTQIDNKLLLFALLPVCSRALYNQSIYF